MSRNPITWQQVAAPSLNGSVEALVSALKGAGSTINSTFQGVEDARKAGAVGELLQRSLGLGSPEEIQAAQRSGQLTQGIDQRYITPEFVKTLDDRVNAGMEQQYKAAALDTEKARLGYYQSDLEFRKTQQQQEISTKQRALEKELTADKDKGVMFEYARLLEAGDPVKAAAYQEQNIETFRRMGEGGAGKIAQGTQILKDKVFGQKAAGLISGTDPFENYKGIRAHLDSIADPLEKAKEEKRFADIGWDVNNPEKVADWKTKSDAIKANRPNPTTPTIPPTWGTSLTPGVLGYAIYGQESSHGKADTSKVNSQNVTGPMQVQEATFEGLKKNGVIPAHYQWENPEHNKTAGFAHIADLAKKYTPEQVAAIYYSGPAAVNPDGSINRNRRNPVRPQDPTVGEYVDQVMKRAGVGSSSTTSSAPAPEKLIAAAATGQPTVPVSPVTAAPSNIFEGLQVSKPFSDTLDVFTETGTAIRNQLNQGNYGQAVGAGIKGAIKTLPALTSDVVGRPVSILATGLGYGTNEVVKGATGIDITGPQKVTPAIATAANAPTTGTGSSLINVNKESNGSIVIDAIEQASRTGNRNAALGLAESTDIGQIAINSAKRSNTNLKDNVEYIRERVGGDGRNFREDDLRTLYTESVQGLPESKLPTISQFTEMLSMSLKRGGALDFGLKSIIPGETFTNSQYRYDPKTLRGYVENFNANHVTKINELLGVASKQSADSKAADESLDSLQKTVNRLEKAAEADPKRFSNDLAFARYNLSEAKAKAEKLAAQTKALQ